MDEKVKQKDDKIVKMAKKKKLTVNSSMEEFEKDVKELGVTLPEAQQIALVIFDKYHKLRRELENFCPKCYKRETIQWSKEKQDKYLKNLKDRVKLLEKVHHRYYPYIKYDWR